MPEQNPKLYAFPTPNRKQKRGLRGRDGRYNAQLRRAARPRIGQARPGGCGSGATMLRYMKIADGRIADDETEGPVLLYIAPDEAERRQIVDGFGIDEHTLNSALDPDEQARVEFQPDHTAMIVKRAKRYSAEDQYLFRVCSTGVFLFQDRLILVALDDTALFTGKPFVKVQSLMDIVLKMIYQAILHFEEHLKIVNAMSNEIEQAVNTAMENKQLLHLFTLEKSLVYYVNAIASNKRVIDKLRTSTARFNFTPENLEYLDDMIIENDQCREQAQVYSNILASLMDARASIVANNLNVLMKTLNIIMIALMLPTLVVSIFSMNVDLPIPQRGPIAFWVVMALAAASVITVCVIWWKKRL
jgi:magnesium transporter